MRETRNAQTSIFDFYAEHEYGVQLKLLSELLDTRPEIIDLLTSDLCRKTVSETGANGLSCESVFRCLLLKQILQVSYERLAFHLSDSRTYRTFARLSVGHAPSRSGLQSTIRQLSDETLSNINQLFVKHWLDEGEIQAKKMRIDLSLIHI